MALDSLDVSGGGIYVSLTPFHIGEAGSDGDQTNNNNNNCPDFIMTSWHQRARRDGRKQKNCSKLLCSILKTIGHGVWKRERRNIQKFKPGRSAMQRHCGLRLFCRNIYSVYITVPYCAWSVVLRRLLSFILINGPKTTLFEVNCWNNLFSFPFEKRARIPCLAWSHVLCA